jgi:hypothetical protein
MYSIESLKSTQLRKLFIIFKSSNMPNFSIFGAKASILIGRFFLLGQAHQSVAQWFLTARASHRTCATHHRPGHRAVTMLTVESAQAPVTAGRHRYPCRGGPPFVLLYCALLTIGTTSVPSVQAKWSALTSCSFCTELLLGGTSYRSRAMEFSAPSSSSVQAHRRVPCSVLLQPCFDF